MASLLKLFLLYYEPNHSALVVGFFRNFKKAIVKKVPVLLPTHVYFELFVLKAFFSGKKYETLAQTLFT